MYTKSITTIYAFGFILYGIYCFVSPQTIVEFIGYATITSDARTEFLAMYGGVQTAIGVFGLYVLFESRQPNPSLLKTNFILLIIIFSALALSRLYGYITMDDLGTYSLIAIIFESVSVILCAIGARQIANQGI